jgi:hypothetical protein
MLGSPCETDSKFNEEMDMITAAAHRNSLYYEKCSRILPVVLVVDDIPAQALFPDHHYHASARNSGSSAVHRNYILSITNESVPKQDFDGR